MPPNFEYVVVCFRSDSSTATSLDDFLGEPRIGSEAKRGKNAAEQADSDGSVLATAKISIFDSSLETLEWQKEAEEANEDEKVLKSAGEDGLRRQDSEGDEYDEADEDVEVKDEEDADDAVVRRSSLYSQGPRSLSMSSCASGASAGASLEDERTGQRKVGMSVDGQRRQGRPKHALKRADKSSGGKGASAEAGARRRDGGVLLRGGGGAAGAEARRVGCGGVALGGGQVIE